MKIAVVSNLYPPFIRGGAEVIAAIQAEGLKKAWQHVFAISTKPKTIHVYGVPIDTPHRDKVTQDEVNEVTVYRFNPLNIYYYTEGHKYPGFIKLIWHFFDIFNVFSYRTVKKILKEENPDLIITHNLMGIGFLLPSLFKELNIKHIHVLHDVQLVTPSGLIIKNKEKAFEHKIFNILGYQRLMKKLMGSPDVVISPSKFLLDFYQQRGFFEKSKKLVLRNPVKKIKRVDHNHSKYFELFYLGQVSKAKGAVDLVKAFDKAKLPNVRLNVIGMGQDMKLAKNLAKKNKLIKFHGWLDHKQIVSLVSTMDLLVVPSLCYENSPTVIFETLSMGLPVIAADIGGVSEAIESGKNGWVFPAGDFDNLMQQVSELNKNLDMVRGMSEYCHQSIEPYLVDKHIEELLKIANEVV